MELNAAPTSGTPAAYGRACSNCARAKAKCISGAGVDAKCQRCLRLNKDCHPLQTVRKRKSVNRPSAAKTERLEEKLDGLYKLLQSSTPSTSIAGQNGTVSTAPTPVQPSPESSQSLDPIPKDVEDFSACSIQRMGWNHRSADYMRLHSPTTALDSLYVTTGTRSTIYQRPESPLICGFEPSSDEAEKCLNIFRTHSATYFPFAIVPDSTTAHELRRERPFLWICIMSITSKSSVKQVALGKEIRIMMGREILVEGKVNLDLLLGALTFVAWGHYHNNEKPIITQVIQLAMALVADLGLNKPPLKEPTQMMLNFDARGCPIKPFSPSTRTMEERRAVLGCFLLSSVYGPSSLYDKECLTVLAESKEHPSDVLLAHLVKLQLVVERLRQAPWHDGHGDPTGLARAPPAFYLKALQAELQDIRVKLPPEIQRNDILLLHLYSTEVRVHEIAFSKAPAVINSPGFQRLDGLYACLHATKSWWDVFLAFPPASYVGFSAPIFTQMAHCIIILFRLLTFDDPVWDRGLVRDTANLSLILGQVIERIIQAKVAMNLDEGVLEGKDALGLTAATLESIKIWWDAKLAAESMDNVALDQTLGGSYMDNSDDVWLKDILGQGDFQFDLNVQWPSAGTGF
ncbi:MAG: hypothetical protein ASARMPREDX12_002379 [Alectoria sarmentosa]|nr:MAG: hypothetical protein ASARMPREDX12_002379 [Alectoria sarmentosa]